MFISQNLIQYLSNGSTGLVDRFRSKGNSSLLLTDTFFSSSFSAPASDSSSIFFRCHRMVFFFMFFCQILGLAVNNSDCINVLVLLCFPEKIKLIGFSGLYSSLTLMRSYEKSRYKKYLKIVLDSYFYFCFLQLPSLFL